jgi:2'-5' RNA ligase
MRLFVAIWPPPEIVARLELLDRPARPDVRWTAPAQWHITLSFLGDAVDLDDAKDGLARAGLAWKERTLAEAGPATACFGRSVLYVPIHGLLALAKLVQTTLPPRIERSRALRAAPSFTGHLTLARGRRAGSRTGGIAGLSGAPFSAAWPVEQLTLVASTLSEGGPRYSILSSVSRPRAPSSNCG